MRSLLQKPVFLITLSLSLFVPFCASSQTVVPSPIFRASFDKGTDAEVSGSPLKPLEDSAVSLPQGVRGAAISVPRGKQLVYEGSGNAYIPSGTLSFFWRPDEEPGESESNVFNINGFQRFYFCRWLRVYTYAKKLRLSLYTGDNNNDKGIELSARDATFVKGAWHHVAVTWDQGRGVALYADGKLAAASSKPWFYGGNVNHIGLAVSASSYTKPSMATWAQSFDEVQIYERWMEAADIARLAQNETPQNEIASLQPMLQERATRLGLDSKASLPVLSSDNGQQALHLKQIALPTARDVLSTTRSGLDGDLGRAWPIMQGYSNSGKQLQISLEPNATFDTVQAFGNGPMKFVTPAQGPSERALLELPAGNTRMEAAKLAQPVRADQLLVRREAGLLFNVQLFNSSTTALPAAGQNGWAFHPLGVVATPAAATEPAIAGEFASYDRLTLTTAGKPTTSAATLELPAMQALHLLGPSSTEMRGLSTLALDLAVGQDTPETALSLVVVDPLNYERRTAMVNIKTEASPNGGRLRLVLDLRDLVLPKGKQPWLILYSQKPLRLDVANSHIGFQWSSVDAALTEFLPDQMAYARDAFQELSEARPWSHDPNKRKWLRSMLNILDMMHTLRPNDVTVRGYWHWTHPNKPIALTKLPDVPTGVAPWAIYTDRSLDKFREAAHWWIDNRMTPEGEFGAPDNLNDDTDLIQDWAAIDLMRGPDPKIRHAIDLVANATWYQTTTDGVSNQVTDTLHIYEWGINAQTLAFMLNIGDPVYYERLLRFASHYDELTTTTGKNHRHFKSWYFGANKIVTEGIYGQDRQVNSLLLQPAMLLAWYNGDPKSRDLVADWSRTMMEHIDEQAAASSRVPGASVQVSNDETIPERNFGIAFPEAVWAAYDLTGDRSFLESYGRLVDYEISRKPQEGLLRTTSTLAAYLRESGDSRWDEYLKKEASDPTLWSTSQHNSNYRPLHAFDTAWLRTGDDEWLNQGAGVALHHLNWSLPMLTLAEQTTDRVWLPENLANRMVLGDIPILRNQIYPKHSVSWEGADGRIAPLVRKQSRDELEIEIYNLENRPVKVGARLWRLNHGRYEVRTTSTAQADAKKVTTNVDSQILSRFGLLPLTLAPSSVTTITLKKTAALEDLSQATDLGISRHDATFSKAGLLTFKVHNIGAKASGAFKVRVIQNGKTLSEQSHQALLAPENFRTHKAVFSILVAERNTPVTIEILPEGKLAEITTVNNNVTFVPSERPEQEGVAAKAG